jgi:methylphosphonate synthase
VSPQTTYLQRAGATFRTLINDLKRNEEAAARELGVDVSVIRAVIAGERPLTPALIEKSVALWPVNERDFFPIHDDTSDGVLIMRRRESEASSRVFQRAGSDYYEYRDTAMSRAAMIRPEWIRMLRVVADNDPENPAVQWNNGHFLYQFTYFVGEVNYYYEWKGRKHCAPMVTGDSVFGLPFARHSFASRNPDSRALILALTYGGRLMGDGQHELGVLGEEAACKYVLPLEDPGGAQAALLRLHMTNGSYTTDYLAAASGVGRERLERALGGEGLEAEELAAVADALRVPVRELAACASDATDGVRIVRRADAPAWFLPDEERPCYRVRELAASRVTPYTKSLELEVYPDAGAWRPLATGLHEYGYNQGGAPVALVWECEGGERREVIEPDDSFYVKPHVTHRFEPADGSAPTATPSLLLLRVGGKVVGDAALEVSIIGRESLRRVVAETTCWYDAGKDRAAS